MAILMQDKIILSQDEVKALHLGKGSANQAALIGILDGGTALSLTPVPATIHSLVTETKQGQMEVKVKRSTNIGAVPIPVFAAGQTPTGEQQVYDRAHTVIIQDDGRAFVETHGLLHAISDEPQLMYDIAQNCTEHQVVCGFAGLVSLGYAILTLHHDEELTEDDMDEIMNDDYDDDDDEPIRGKHQA